VDKYAVEGRPLGARKAVPQARPHTRGDQALAQPTLQKIPFCTSLTDQTEGAVPLQNGGSFAGVKAALHVAYGSCPAPAIDLT
jgi:hypothetical protein